MSIKKIWLRVLLVVFVDTKMGAAFLITDCLIHCTAMRDVVVVATPVYGLSFPAPLKAVFDRTQQYYEAYVSRHIKHPFEKPKKAFIVCLRFR